VVSDQFNPVIAETSGPSFSVRSAPHHLQDAGKSPFISASNDGPIAPNSQSTSPSRMTAVKRVDTCTGRGPDILRNLKGLSAGLPKRSVCNALETQLDQNGQMSRILCWFRTLLRPDPMTKGINTDTPTLNPAARLKRAAGLFHQSMDQSRKSPASIEVTDIN
jgi:hypothetical protein